ncbi:MAG: hypothetical protein HC830_09585 [Bacteroidetes bacterium]|nr:hypothetical protein [Bacteroidota bacterium]
MAIDQRIPDFGYYQFMERRYLFNFDLTKGFDMQLQDNKSIGINVGGKLLFSTGKYRGTNIQINGGFGLAPVAWMFYRNRNFETRLGYHFSNYGEKGFRKSHFTVGLLYHFHNSKALNLNRKLKWIE